MSPVSLIPSTTTPKDTILGNRNDDEYGEEIVAQLIAQLREIRRSNGEAELRPGVFADLVKEHRQIR